jgi:hypothetical protein
MSGPFRFCMDRHELWKIYMYVVSREAGRTPSQAEIRLLAPILEDMRVILEVTNGKGTYGQVPPNPTA